MDFSDELDTKTRTANKFYARIRSHLEDLELVEPERAKPVSEKLKDLKEEEKYGLVKQKDFDRYLKAHEQNPNKPVKCDQLEATSLSKSLFSKPSFHNAGSTAYLKEDLRIKDLNRNSFLGGHSTYSISRENNLAHILNCQQTMYIKRRAKDILDEMERTQLDEVREIDVKDLIDLDPRNGDALAVKGVYSVLRRRFDRAVDDLKAALQNDCNFSELVGKNLSIACFEVGFEHYNRHDFKKAFQFFDESLKYNPQHQGARMHLELCNNKMLAYERRPFGIQDSFGSYSQRRK